MQYILSMQSSKEWQCGYHRLRLSIQRRATLSLLHLRHATNSLVHFLFYHLYLNFALSVFYNFVFTDKMEVLEARHKQEKKDLQGSTIL